MIHHQWIDVATEVPHRDSETESWAGSGVIAVCTAWSVPSPPSPHIPEVLAISPCFFSHVVTMSYYVHIHTYHINTYESYDV